MPPVLRKDGFRFFIPTLDHAPAHVHVEKGNGQAKFHLFPEVELVKTDGLKMQDINKAFEIAREHRDELLNAWREIHGNH